MPSSPDPRSPVFFEILCGLLLSSWPKASDEADGNTGRPQPGFFRITGKKIFELTSDGLGGELFSSDIMWWLGDWIRLILHQLPFVPKTGFPWSIPPDLAPLTPSDRYPELDNKNFFPVQVLTTQTPLNFPTRSPRRGRTLYSQAWILWLSTPPIRLL